MTENIMQIRPYPLGAHCEGGLVRFAFVSEKEDCGIVLYDRKSGRKLKQIPFKKEERIGNVYCKYLENIDVETILYQFYEGKTIIPDEQARIFVGKSTYGKSRKEAELKAGFLTGHVDWEEDKRPHIPYEDCICYCAHVRGFTRHATSGVANRGTFSGMAEKIPYLKEIGITTVELQPVYEFLELPAADDLHTAMDAEGSLSGMSLSPIPAKLNYWGYKKGFYYAPKAAYAAGEDASVELKEMIKAFHKNGMEVILQFYFPNQVETQEIPEILRFWILNYHVDGFHLMGENIPTTMLAKDPLFADTKLWYYEFDEDTIYGRYKTPAYRNLARCREDYRCIMRRYLKGDENMLRDVLVQMRYNPERMGNIHYMSNYDGMTLMDMVSYDRKHNEANGEENRDGNPYNFSWNCGEEGPSRKKKIVELRKKQMKNAMAMLLFSQSTPLIFMGDEFGNSQKGNNNPYCQDNAIAWLDWRDLERNQDILEFWKYLVALRKKHPVLHGRHEYTMMDAKSCGYPDLSYHGQHAWRAQTESYNRHAGILLCGKYAVKDSGEEDTFLYIGMNMYWQPQRLALPNLPKGMEWKCVFSTSENCSDGKPCTKEANMLMTAEKREKNSMDAALDGKVQMIPARTICLFEGV